MRPVSPHVGITEASFTQTVIALARLRGWRCAHFRASRTARGWRTAVSGHGVGFPDLILVRADRLLVAELKVRRNRPTDEQTMWLDAFRMAGAEVVIWRPDDWPEIEEMLA